MQESSHIRAISLILAFSVIAAGWFLLEYSSRPTSFVTSPSATSPKPLPGLTSLNQAIVPPAPIPGNLSITYKCEKAGHISFSDKPCNHSEKTLAVTATEIEPPRPNNDLERQKNAVASMKAERLEREKKYAARAMLVSGTSNTSQFKEARCKQIDLAIIAKDSELRQPHSAQWGDYLTGERKKLTDERFSLGC